MPPKNSKKRKAPENDDDEYDPSADWNNDDDYLPEAGGIKVAAAKKAGQVAKKRLDDLKKGSGAPRGIVAGGTAARLKKKGRAGGAGGALGGFSMGTSGGLTSEGEGGEELSLGKDFADLELKPDHASRPLWVCPDGTIYLEASSPVYRQAYDFLVAIAEPVTRPEFVHEYRITPHSLYAAVAVAIDTRSIIRVLNRLSKCKVPAQVEEFVRECTVRYGKAKVVLKQNKYYVESPHPHILQALLKNPKIAAARLRDDEVVEGAGGGAGEGGFTLTEAPQELETNLDYKELAEGEEGDDQDPDVMLGTQPGERLHNVSFRIDSGSVEEVKRAALEMDYPLMEEYDFRNDNVNQSLRMDLKPTTKIRAYQERSLSKMFGNGRARSGIIVLPCGAGKTLTGVTAASTIKKSCIVLCTSAVSCLQWKYQFQLWTDMPDKKISCFTSDIKDPIDKECGVVITTYTMISFGGKRAADAQQIINIIQEREWGCMLLDEVHVVPAQMFRKVLGVVKAHCKMGLTATLVREDELISDLNFLIGPKLYEANWMDLTQAGYLANVQCVEAWCPMTAEFFKEYLRGDLALRQKELLYVMNPNKFRTCEYLVEYHKQRGDKIILFADNVFALKQYSNLLKIPFIYGGTREQERQKVLGLFRTNAGLNVVGLSKVGDTSIDIPEANVIIQVSSHFGSRRQEAQRLGRILRPKKGGQAEGGGFNAFFYTLVSTDTAEMYYSTKRQQYLVDQGYTFKVVTHLVEQASQAGYASKLPDRSSEIDLLQSVLLAEVDREEAEEEASLRDKDGDQLERAQVKRRTGNMEALSGGGGAKYLEYSSGASNPQPITKKTMTSKNSALMASRYQRIVH